MKTLILFIGLFLATGLSAQEIQSEKKSLYLIDGAVASEKIVQEISPDKIESVSVYKTGDNLPATLSKFAQNISNGIVDVQLKSPDQKATYFTLGDINAKFSLSAKNRIFFNGNILDDPTTKILRSAVKDFKLVQYNDTSVLEAAVN